MATVSGRAQLRINEFMAVNQSTLADGCGSFEDWLEIYNAGDSAVNLNGYTLSDDPQNLQKFKLKSKGKQQLMIPAHGYLLIWCDEDQLEGLTHANFRLAAAGEFLALTGPEGQVLDSVSFDAQTADISYGRSEDGSGEWGLLTRPTPSGANTGIRGFSAAQFGSSALYVNMD
jgi:hypothetical protein